MDEEELREILEDLGLEKVKRKHGRKGINFVFSCPHHTDNHPSAGILLDGHSAYGFCFSCKWRFTLPELIADIRGITPWDAIQQLNEKFNVNPRKVKKHFRDYEDEIVTEQRFELPRVKLAPFRSGKETHKYFFNRGFNRETVKKFLIGWDKVKKRITIPVFYQDGMLAGVIGRAVYDLDQEEYEEYYGHEPKYFIYENFPIGSVLFGEHCFKSEDDTAILVEGSLDIIWMHQLEFTNTLSTIIANFTEKQRNVLYSLGVKNVILMYDNDDAGMLAREVAYQLLKSDFKVYRVVYPKGTKDPMDLNKEQIEYMLEHKKFYWGGNLKKWK